MARTEYFTHPKIAKAEIPAWEQTPFVLNGDLYHAGFRRAWSATCGHGIIIEKFDAVRRCFYKVGDLPTDRYLGCVLTLDDGRVIVFTTTDVAFTENSVMAREVDPETWTWVGEEWEAFQAPVGFSVFNSSACVYPGGYALAVETDEGNIGPDGKPIAFSIRIVTSTDLHTWAPPGGLFYPDIYFACPSIRWVPEAGRFMGTFLWQNKDPALPDDHPLKIIFESGTFWISADFASYDVFHGSPTVDAHAPLMSPDACEGVNNSDVDLAEWFDPMPRPGFPEGGWVVHYVYMTGDQKTWAFNNYARFEGRLIDYYRSLWPA